VIALASALPRTERDLQLIFSDAGGALLLPDHSCSARTWRALAAVIVAVLPVAACTGRGRAGAYVAIGPAGVRLRAEGAPGVFLNGVFIYGLGDVSLLAEYKILCDVTCNVAAFAAHHQVALVALSGDRILLVERCE
jgi:hydroxymethylpyrimidine pyrophosphatase-like HAD family hydrolase